MKTSIISALLLVVVAFEASEAKIFSRCELARILSGAFPRGQLADWNCLVQSESSYNSRARGGPNRNGSYDYGIFQINDGYWCKVGRRGGDCNMDCNDLLNDDISDDIRCAQIIFNRHGFNAWYGWINKCKGRPLQSVNDCF